MSTSELESVSVTRYQKRRALGLCVQCRKPAAINPRGKPQALCPKHHKIQVEQKRARHHNKTGRIRGLIYSYVRKQMADLNRAVTYRDFPHITADQARSALNHLYEGGELVRIERGRAGPGGYPSRFKHR